jgi:hypothetical protein
MASIATTNEVRCFARCLFVRSRRSLHFNSACVVCRPLLVGVDCRAHTRPPPSSNGPAAARGAVWTRMILPDMSSAKPCTCLFCLVHAGEQLEERKAEEEAKADRDEKSRLTMGPTWRSLQLYGYVAFFVDCVIAFASFGCAVCFIALECVVKADWWIVHACACMLRVCVCTCVPTCVLCVSNLLFECGWAVMDCVQSRAGRQQCRGQQRQCQQPWRCWPRRCAAVHGVAADGASPCSSRLRRRTPTPRSLALVSTRRRRPVTISAPWTPGACEPPPRFSCGAGVVELCSLHVWRAVLSAIGGLFVSSAVTCRPRLYRRAVWCGVIAFAALLWLSAESAVVAL